MSELNKTLIKFDTLDASDSVKYQMLRKSIDLLNQGKTAQEAHDFVLSLLKDGHFKSSEIGGKLYTESQLTSFGNYLLSDKRKERFEAMDKVAEEDGASIPPAEERLKAVHHADISNWKNPISESEIPAEQKETAKNVASGVAEQPNADADNAGNGATSNPETEQESK